jgi:DNA-binding CsgD family transcriptional regulator
LTSETECNGIETIMSASHKLNWQSALPHVLRLADRSVESDRSVEPAVSIVDGWRLELRRVEHAGANVIAVLVHQDATLTDEELKRRFRLTPAEVRVARLLAQRRRNDEIARELFISPHTTRRHTESVLLKLNVSSRTRVAACLESGLGPDATGLL